MALETTELAGDPIEDLIKREGLNEHDAQALREASKRLGQATIRAVAANLELSSATLAQIETIARIRGNAKHAGLRSV